MSKEKSDRYWVIKRKDGHRGPDKFFQPGTEQWEKLSRRVIHVDRDAANRSSEDASRHGSDPSRPCPTKVVPVRIVEEDE